jgi:RHS repeat-associated protein
VGLSGNGQVTLVASTPVNAIIDVVGYFAWDAPTWAVTLRDESSRLSADYTVPPVGGGSIARVKNYFYLGNLLVATRDAAGGYTYYASDHLGTPRVATGAVTETHKYQPFGTEITTAFGNQPLKFAAMERDSSSGNDFDHARYQSSLLGRFLGPDLLQGAAYDPQTWNRYTYAKNNPLGYVDPTGLISTTVIGCPQLQICAEEEITVTAADPGKSGARAQADIISGLLGPLGNGRLHAVFENAAQRNFQQGRQFIGSVDSLLAFLTPEDRDETLILLLTAGKTPGLAKLANPRLAAHLEQQLLKDGPASILRSLRSLERRLTIHIEKLPNLKYGSSVEREIRTFKRDIETIKQFIKHKGIG